MGCTKAYWTNHNVIYIAFMGINLCVCNWNICMQKSWQQTTYYLPTTFLFNYLPGTTTCFNNYFTKTEVLLLWLCCWCLKLLLHRPWHSGWWARLEGRWLCLSPLLLLLLSYPCFVSHLHRPLQSRSLLLLLLLQVLTTPSPLQQTTLFDACGKYLAPHYLQIPSTYHRLPYLFGILCLSPIFESVKKCCGVHGWCFRV